MMNETKPTTILLGAGVLASTILLYHLLTPKSRKPRGPRKGAAVHKEKDPLAINELDVRRIHALGCGGATDHYGELIVIPNPTFNLDRTIFQSMEGLLPRTVYKNKLGVTLYWSEEAIMNYISLARSIPRAPAHDEPIMAFIRNDCNFATEHADGSFIDHLQFCYEYSAAYYKQYSPRVLFLHSIMGVGTNFFPMDKSKIPQLQTMVSDFEMRHIESFPSFLRLIIGSSFLDELISMDRKKLDAISKVTFHRVIDNKDLSLDVEDVWIQLNYQMIHLLDFIPVSNWKAQLNDNMFQHFNRLLEFLTSANRLYCKLDYDLSSGESSMDGMPVTVASVLDGWAPSALKRKLGADAIKQWSKKIGHSLEYKVHFNQ